MTETQREPVPRNDGGERDTALAFLRFARSGLLRKTEGLAEEQLRRAVVPSVTSLLGLVQHLTDGEHLSVRWVLAHRTSETARHAGHADILREQLDGVTGR